MPTPEQHRRSATYFVDIAMTTSNPLFTPTSDGTYDIQPAGVLLLLAEYAYGPQEGPGGTGNQGLDATIQTMLAAAREGGYKQTDILHTLLVRCERSKRIQDMARKACDAIGDARMGAIFADMRKGLN